MKIKAEKGNGMVRKQGHNESCPLALLLDLERN